MVDRQSSLIDELRSLIINSLNEESHINHPFNNITPIPINYTQSSLLNLLRETIPIVRRTTQNVSGSVPDVSGSVPDVSGSVPDVSGSVPDVSGSDPYIRRRPNSTVNETDQYARRRPLQNINENEPNVRRRTPPNVRRPASNARRPTLDVRMSAPDEIQVNYINRRNNYIDSIMNNYSRCFNTYQSQISEYQSLIRLHIENINRNDYEPENFRRRESRNEHYINIPSTFPSFSSFSQSQTSSSSSSSHPSSSRYSFPATLPIYTTNLNTNINNETSDEETELFSGIITMTPESIAELLRSITTNIFSFDISNNMHENLTDTVLSNEAVDNIITANSTVFIFNPAVYINNDICPISLDQFVEGEEIVKLNVCGHMFKKPLIVNWISRRNRCCPVCRRTLTSEIINTETETN
jgi:hypothetical protein